MFYTAAAMILCRLCRKQIAVSDVANPESYAGEDITTCIACAERATVASRAQGRVHRRTARDPDTKSRQARKQSLSGFKPDSLAVVETWALCGRCLAHLKDNRVVRLKSDGRFIRWMETDHGHQVDARLACDACHARRAERYAVLRLARPQAAVAG
jgi:hypothetical protein